MSRPHGPWWCCCLFCITSSLKASAGGCCLGISMYQGVQKGGHCQRARAVFSFSTLKPGTITFICPDPIFSDILFLQLSKAVALPLSPLTVIISFCMRSFVLDSWARKFSAAFSSPTVSLLPLCKFLVRARMGYFKI